MIRRRFVPAALTTTIIALLAVVAVGPADSPGRPLPASVVGETPVDYTDGPPISPGQVEREYQQTQRCRAILGAPRYVTRHQWRTTPSQAYRAWTYDLWRHRHDACETAVEKAQHTDLMVAMRVVFPEWTWPRWRIILRCETGGTFSNSVVGDAGETSGFQIHPPSHPWYDEDRGHVDALYGARSAQRVLESQGWGAWTCARINGLA